MTISLVSCTILNGLGVALILGMPGGRQLASDSSAPCASVLRSLVSASAHGWIGNSPGLKSAAMFTRYLVPRGVQIPDRSGLLSGLRGAGADMLTFPSAVRGMPSVGSFSHCAPRGNAKSASRGSRVLIHG